MNNHIKLSGDYARVTRTLKKSAMAFDFAQRSGQSIRF
jgi:hypothetical protein